MYAGIGLYALTFILFYPRVFAIVDEDAYLTQALLFRSGHLTYDGSPIPAPHMTVDIAGRQVSKYPPGNSLFLLPFTVFGWRGVFLSGLLLAIAGTLLFRSVLRRLEPRADPAWSLLYLTYPAVVLFSRTMMSDLLAATLLLAALFFLLKGKTWVVAAGAAIGFACLVRYSSAAVVPVFLILAIIGARKKTRAALLLLAGVLPFALLAVGYNTYAYGGPFRFPMYLTGQLSPGYFVRNLTVYAVSLLLLYPAMLLAPLAAGRKRRIIISLPAYAILLLYCLFSYVHTSPGLAERLTVGMRYLLSAVPFFVLGYVLILNRLLRGFRWATPLRLTVITAMLILSVAIQYRHHRYLNVQDSYRQMLYETVPESALLICNKDISELVSYAWGWRRYRRYVEFNTPVPTRRAISRNDTVYAAILQKPGKTNTIETLLFHTLLASYPQRRIVVETAQPYRFSLYELKPASGPQPRTGPSATHGPAGQDRPR